MSNVDDAIKAVKRARGKPKGLPRSGGRKAGVPNKVTVYLRQAMADVGCNIEVALAKAINSSDIKMIEALALILPYFVPKFRESDAPKQEQVNQEAAEQAEQTPLSMEDESVLLQIAKK